MKFAISKHNMKSEMDVLQKSCVDEVSSCIESLKMNVQQGSGTKIREHLIYELIKNGWAKDFRVSVNSQISITAKKNSCGLCIQTGNMARMYADLIKLQSLGSNGIIDIAIIVVPSLEMAKEIGGNIANSDRLIRELEIFKAVISNEIVIFSMG